MKMKNFLVTMLCLMAMTAVAQKAQRVMVPGKGNIDVEQLNKRVNLNQDISQLSLTELRVLRNSFYAREGFPFRDAFLRGVFQCTSWYDSLMWARWGKVEDLMTGYERDDYYKADGKLPFKISKPEYAFINKLQAREKELKLQNFKPHEGVAIFHSITDLAPVTHSSSFCNVCILQLHVGSGCGADFRGLGLSDHTEQFRHCDGGENAHDHDNDHQFNKGKTLLLHSVFSLFL